MPTQPSNPRIWKDVPPRPAGPRPDWIKVKLARGPEYNHVQRMLRGLALHTVCEEARCPNIYECWSQGTATFMIAGENCTRGCAFCSVGRSRLLPLDPEEPSNVAAAVARMELRHAVITSVTRDDQPDGGAAHWAATIRAVRAQSPGTSIEVLIPDFQGNWDALALVIEARPEVLSHNLETVEQLHDRVRPRADYARSLEMLARMAGARTADYPVIAKTGLMLGLGETDVQITRTLRDCAAAGVEVLTLGQYLAPTPDHHPILRWVTPEEFGRYREEALSLGFREVVSGPLVRSSYRAHLSVPQTGTHRAAERKSAEPAGE